VSAPSQKNKAVGPPTTAVSPPPVNPATALPTSTLTLTGAEVLALISKATDMVSDAQGMILTLLAPPMTAKQTKALVKARQAGKNVAPSLIQEAISKPNLAPNGMTPAQLQYQLNYSATIMLLEGKLSALASRVLNTSRVLQAEQYKLALSVYAIAEQNTLDPGAQSVAARMKQALSNGPRNPKRQVTTLPKPITVTYTDPDAAAAAQAAVAAMTGTTTGSGKGKKQAPAAPAGGGDTTADSSTPAAPPNVPVYTPAGPAGTAPATNVVAGSSSTHS